MYVKESEVAQLCSTLCDPMDCIAYQAPPSMQVFQARILEWVAISFSRDLTQVSRIVDRRFTI